MDSHGLSSRGELFAEASAIRIREGSQISRVQDETRQMTRETWQFIQFLLASLAALLVSQRATGLYKHHSDTANDLALQSRKLILPLVVLDVGIGTIWASRIDPVEQRYTIPASPPECKRALALFLETIWTTPYRFMLRHELRAPLDFPVILYT